jgi:hypothetical protein
MRKDDPVLKAAQRELERHVWGHYVEGDPNGRTMAQGGKGTIAGRLRALQSVTHDDPEVSLAFERRRVAYAS